MNIAYYSHYFAPEVGAPSARIYDLARQWLELGHRVEVITCFPNHPSGKMYPGYVSRPYMYEELDGIDVHRHWTYITPNQGFVRKSLGHVSYLPSALLLSSRRLRRRPDAIIGTSPTFFASMAASAAGRRRRAPFIMEVRDLWPAAMVELGVLSNGGAARALERLELSLYARAARVVTVTESFRLDLIERGVPARKVFTVPNGADVDFWRPTVPPAELKRSLGLGGRFVALYMGAHGISQALGRVLDGAGLLREHADIHFLFVGAGAEKEQLRRGAAEAGLRNVQFLEPVGREAAREFYAMADVCLIPLRDVPLFGSFIPSKMFEAMAMGRPVVGSVRGEAADILRRSGGALLVEPEDSRAIAGAVLGLSRDAERAREMGRRGREFVVANYSRRSLAAAYLSVIEGAVEEHRDARR